MFNQRRRLPEANALVCPECEGRRFVFTGSTVKCTNCGWKEKTASNKYGAKKQVAQDGIKRDSK